MLRQLEEAWDQAEPADDADGRSATCRAGDELVAELEEFLRDQRPD